MMAVATSTDARPERKGPPGPPPVGRVTLTREQADLLRRIIRRYRFGLPDLT